MKSNISKKEIESGREIIEKLSQLNFKLLPQQLKEIIPDYKSFYLTLINMVFGHPKKPITKNLSKSMTKFYFYFLE